MTDNVLSRLLHFFIGILETFIGGNAALGLYAAAFIALDNDIDPFMRAIHQQSEWAAWAGAAACTAVIFSAIERLIKL